MSDREKLFYFIHQISFAVDEIVLYLDTHPTDEKALKYYEYYSDLERNAKKDYAMNFAPIDYENVNVDSNIWEWVVEPFPWERECC